MLGTPSDSLLGDSPGQLGLPAGAMAPKPQPGREAARVHSGTLPLLVFLPASRASSEPSLKTLT